ncbi:sugar phosphate isomerase/epimerase [Deferribacter autotrophicus]|uniref:Sugar phosphate isomerase/epimerase n=1 Tax=Deferribacter autotrophicus TaxID=500465 RepID=A0A5A8F5Q3_9BACT|nr:sugar phosphate isomerase/epimerase [Deferribacter autotrophicus]KAA0258440.1 sugar phosphate isomerase/epimerase [Deferribacter autotrophicus]
MATKWGIKLYLARIPFKVIEKYTRYILENDVNVELTLEFDDIDKEINVKNLKKNIKTVHLPFFDIHLGSKNRYVRDLSFQILLKSIEAVKYLEVENVVMHHNYIPYHYAFMEDEFVDRFCGELLNILKETNPSFTISLENVFEETPEVIYKILKNMDDKRVGICFDFGHFNLFSKVSVEYWVEKLKDYIYEYHIHNNFGVRDDHNSVDKGSFDFKKVFKLFVPKFLVFENNNIDDFERSVKIVKKVVEESYEYF